MLSVCQLRWGRTVRIRVGRTHAVEDSLLVDEELTEQAQILAVQLDDREEGVEIKVSEHPSYGVPFRRRSEGRMPD